MQIEGQHAAQLSQAANAALAATIRDVSLIDENGKYGIADGIQAVKVVRAHATEWGISPDRIVFTGFSAGVVVTAFAALNPDARPNYAAPIYGVPSSRPCRRYQQDCRRSSWLWPRTTTWLPRPWPVSMTHSSSPDTNRSFTSLAPAVMALACANKAKRAITGSTSFTTGWKLKGSRAVK